MTATRYMEADEATLGTLGVRVVAGRNFSATDIHPLSKRFFQSYPAVIITQSLAGKLFPGGNALGKPIYSGDDTPMTIIGITSNFIPSVRDSPAYDALLLPQTPGDFGLYYCLVRTRPGMTAALLQTAERHLATSNLDRVVFVAHTLAYYRQTLDAGNRDMAIFLTTVTALILAVTCLGIFGLTSFNVSTRTKQIGTLRAVGARSATSSRISWSRTRSFSAPEDWSAACSRSVWVTGSPISINSPAWIFDFLAIGLIALAVIGQLAAWQPARRAAAVPPSVATRTV